MSEKLALILAMGVAGKFAGMVVPELTKRSVDGGKNMHTACGHQNKEF